MKQPSQTLLCYTFVVVAALLLPSSATAQILPFAKQKTAGKQYVLAFYNVENLFDIYNDPTTLDDDFTPTGRLHWTKERYQTKLKNLSTVISRIENYAPDILGLCEVENKQVLEDLVNTDYLRLKDYGIVHYDSPDERGIDVALLYKRYAFKPLVSKAYPVNLPDDKTRDVLLVSGILGGKDTLHVLVCHFPSRSGDVEKSARKRMEAARTVRLIIEAIRAGQPHANIVVMGDFNDEPTDASIWDGLKARPHSFNLAKDELYNAMGVLDYLQEGSYCYRGSWQMLDQIILSAPLLNPNSRLHYKIGSARIFNPDYLREKSGEYQGYPLRTYAGEKYLGGYSDHFPVYIILEQLPTTQ
jgi:endonuclease/exonuclease/phosphatase family metal-dependent hydrolase